LLHVSLVDFESGYELSIENENLAKLTIRKINL